MHPILFKIPLPSFNLRIAWIPFIIAALAALYAATRMIGKEKDRGGALIGLGVAVVAILARFTVLAGNTDTWNVEKLPIYSYGVMLGLSLVVGWYLTLGLAERDGLPKETMANNYVVTAIAAVAGSRILYILTNLHEFDTFASFFAMRKGGLVAYGGFLGGLAGSYFFLRRHKIPLLPWADVAVPSLASGLMITRIGCYLFGCDFGQPLSENAPGWLKKLGTFPHWPEGMVDAGSGSPAWSQHRNAGLISPTAEASLPVHPTQIYESLVGLALLALLLWARKKQKFRGQIFFLFAFAYGVARYMLEILRDDAERGSIPPELPKHILIPLGIALLAVGYVIGFSKQIENKTVRLVSQIAAFIPAVLLYVAMVPAQFGQEKPYQYSTSQFIAITTGFAACLAFSVFYKAALAHPKHAMDLGLPREFLPEGAAPPEVDDEEDDEEEERAVKKPVKPAKASGAKTGPSAKGKAKKKAKPAPKPAVEDEDDGEEERAPEKKAEKDEEEEDEAGEPVKAG
jgi:phosphatidylglycerol:prolipoprotein diacylglycerol transferase